MNWVSIGSDNGLSPGRRQAIILTNADILSIRPQGTYFNEIVFEIQIISFKKIHFNTSSAKWQPFCPGGHEFNLLMAHQHRKAGMAKAWPVSGLSTLLALCVGNPLVTSAPQRASKVDLWCFPLSLPKKVLNKQLSCHIFEIPGHSCGDTAMMCLYRWVSARKM